MVAPNSMLAFDGTERKMQALQLAQMGLMDAVSLAEALGVPNYGSFPAIPLPPLTPPTPELTQLVMQSTLAAAPQIALGAPPPPVTDPQTGQQYVMDPMTGQLMELRVPVTVLERLQAQQQIGLGLVISAQGRKATNAAPAHTETKNDRPGGRQTISTSQK
jgi:hypothetical protein